LHIESLAPYSNYHHRLSIPICPICPIYLSLYLFPSIYSYHFFSLSQFISLFPFHLIHWLSRLAWLFLGDRRNLFIVSVPKKPKRHNSSSSSNSNSNNLAVSNYLIIEISRWQRRLRFSYRSPPISTNQSIPSSFALRSVLFNSFLLLSFFLHCSTVSPIPPASYIAKDILFCSVLFWSRATLATLVNQPAAQIGLIRESFKYRICPWSSLFILLDRLNWSLSFSLSHSNIADTPNRFLTPSSFSFSFTLFLALSRLFLLLFRHPSSWASLSTDLLPTLLLDASLCVLSQRPNGR